MPRSPNFQHLTYTPSAHRTRSEIWIDRIVPPILGPDGCRWDDDYTQRVLFHLFDIGGPYSKFTSASCVWDRILDIRDAVWECCKNCRKRTAKRWAERRKSWARRVRKWMGRPEPLTATPADEDEGDENESEINEDDWMPRPYYLPDERTSLLPPRALPHHNYPINDNIPYSYTLPCSPTRPPSSPRPALSNSKLGKNVFKKLKVWRWRNKTVRFSEDDHEWVFSRPPWEPRGCTLPNYANLLVTEAETTSLEDDGYPTPSSSLQTPQSTNPRIFVFRL